MSNIKIFSLGGLDELGKNCYIVEINNDIFVFDCGLKYANENLYGIDYIIPDFDYLIENQILDSVDENWDKISDYFIKRDNGSLNGYWMDIPIELEKDMIKI